MKILAGLFLAVIALIPFTTIGCATTKPDGAVAQVRQKLADLPETTFNTIEVTVHDLSAIAIKALVTNNNDLKIPLLALSDAALSVLEKEVVNMTDLLELEKTLNDIKEGKVKNVLAFVWQLLEINNVVRRDDLTANLTNREQRLVIAMMHGVKLGCGEPSDVDKILNSTGPRY